MLKVFRDNLKYLSWVLWLVIAVFILFVFQSFGSAKIGGSTASEAAATVGSYKVTYGDFERTYRQAEENLRRAYGQQFTPEMARQTGLPLQVLDSLVNDKIMLAEADRMGIRVADDEIRRYILGLPVFLDSEGGFVGEETYREILRSNGLTVDDFEASIRQDLVNRRVESVLSQNLFVSDQEVEEAYRERVERAKVRFLQLPAERFASAVSLTPDEVEAFFDSHSEDYRIPENRVVEYLLIDPGLLQESLEITDEEIRAYYDQRPDEFTQAEQVQARHILLRVGSDRSAEEAESELTEVRQQIEAGADFAVLAGEISDDPGSKSRGGDLGFFGRGQMVPEFEEAAFSAQPGDLVGPIRSDFGYHLIQVLDRQEAGLLPFDQAQERVRSQMLGDRSRTLAESKASELADRIRAEGLSDPEALRALADDESGVTFHASDPFGRDDNVAGIGRATEFSVTAFELETGNVSDPVRVARGWAVLALRDVQEPRTPELEEVRGEVETALGTERQLELARERLAAAREALAGDKTFEDLATELNLEIEESTPFGSTGPVGSLGEAPAVAAAALELKTGDLGGPLLHERSAVLFEVTERQRFDPGEFESAKEQTRATVREQKLNLMIGSLLSQRREELDVRYDSQLMDSLQPAGDPTTGT
jgi:peptidyl-prolyl cis-trans isomerase D